MSVSLLWHLVQKCIRTGTHNVIADTLPRRHEVGNRHVRSTSEWLLQLATVLRAPVRAVMRLQSRFAEASRYRRCVSDVGENWRGLHTFTDVLRAAFREPTVYVVRGSAVDGGNLPWPSVVNTYIGVGRLQATK